MLKMYCTLFRTFPGYLRPLPQVSRSPLVQFIMHDESSRRNQRFYNNSSNESFVNSKSATAPRSQQQAEPFYNPILPPSSSTVKMGPVPKKKAVELNAAESSSKGFSSQGGRDDERPNFDVLQQVHDVLFKASPISL